MAIGDISGNLFGDGLKSAQSLVKAEGTRLASLANLQVAGQNTIDTANLQAAVLSQIPVFDAGAPGGAVPGAGIPTGLDGGAGGLGGGGLVPI
jgi:hypothetical protein